MDAVGDARARRVAAHGRRARAGVRVRRRGVGNAAENAAGPPLIAPPFAIRALGRTDYAATWHAMQAFTAARAPDTPDAIWTDRARAHLHARARGPARTSAARQRHSGRQGRPRRASHLSRSRPARRCTCSSTCVARGSASATWSGALEGAVVHWLESVGVSAYGKASAPGVYVMRANGEAKIAALGLKVRNGCTYHGLAVNVAMDLAPFADIDPCGYPGLAVTQLADLGVTRTVDRGRKRVGADRRGAGGACAATRTARPSEAGPT